MIITNSIETSVNFKYDDSRFSTMDQNQAIQMQIEMIRSQTEAQKNMFRQMYDAEQAEALCAQLDRSMEMQISMISGVGDAMADMSDPMAAAKAVMTQLGYSEEDAEDMLGTTRTDKLMDPMDPEEFGEEDIVSVLDLIRSLPEGEPVSGDAEHDPMFPILVTGIISALNGHSLDGLDVEERTEENRSEIGSMLSEMWGIEDAEDLKGRLSYLFSEGHTQEFVDCLKASDPSELFTEDMDDDDRAIAHNRFVFAHVFSDAPIVLMKGWDLGRAANLVRWGYFMDYLSEGEARELLGIIALSLSKCYGSWREYAASYLFGSMFWRFAWGNEACYMNAYGIASAVEELLDGGAWSEHPWIATGE